MASKHAPARKHAPSGADNLRLINNIRAEVEQRLYRAGILTYEKLADLSPEAIAELLAGVRGVSAAHIEREKWIDQARALSTQSSQSGQPDKATITNPPSENEEIGTADIPETFAEELDTTNRQRSAIFTVQLELRPDGSVRRTLAKHARTESGDEEAEQWSGWDAARLVAFIEQRAKFQRMPESTMAAKLADMPTATAARPAQTPLEPAMSSLPTSGVDELAVLPASAGHSTPPAPRFSETPQAKPILRGVLHLRGLEARIVGRPGAQDMLRQGEHLELRFKLDLSEVIAPPDAVISYKAVVYAKQIGGPAHEIVAERTGNLEVARSNEIELFGRYLPPGVYRLLAISALSLANQLDRPQLAAFLQSGLLEVMAIA